VLSNVSGFAAGGDAATLVKEWARISISVFFQLDAQRLAVYVLRALGRVRREDRTNLARSEIAGVHLGDARLDKRADLVMRALASSPGASIPRANGEWAATKANYELLKNDRVTPDALLAPHVSNGIDRCRTFERVLVIGDMTSLDFSSRKQMSGIGPLSGAKDRAGAGLLLQGNLAVSDTGIPLFVARSLVWQRDEADFGTRREKCAQFPIEEKESRKWLESLRVASELKQELGESKRVIATFDAEGDIYEVLHDGVHVHDVDLLIRANHDRKIETDRGTQRLWRFVENHRRGNMTVEVPRARGRKARTATLALSAVRVTIPAPKKLHGGYKRTAPVTLTAINARETSPGRIKDRIKWRLLTTLPCKSVKDVRDIVKLYTRRWLIEQYFRTLKSGCKIEERQLQTAERLLNCLAFDSITAWSILYLMTVSRQHPDWPCTVFFADSQWQPIWVVANKQRAPPKKPPTIREITRMIGRLGGHLGRKGDGEPGAQALWYGMREASKLSQLWQILVPN
jgi:hypothetical protein